MIDRFYPDTRDDKRPVVPDYMRVKPKSNGRRKTSSTKFAKRFVSTTMKRLEEELKSRRAV